MSPRNVIGPLKMCIKVIKTTPQIPAKGHEISIEVLRLISSSNPKTIALFIPQMYEKPGEGALVPNESIEIPTAKYLIR